MSLYGRDGRRKYLTAEKRAAFPKAAESVERDVRTFCGLLAYSGCRISEALAVTADRVDLAAGLVVLESLKKRRPGVYCRAAGPARCPRPGARPAQGAAARGRRQGRGAVAMEPHDRLAPRRRGDGITGPHATPKGLRHGFGVAAVTAGIPLNLAQRWMGHAQLSTTAIYAEAVGEEERSIASRMW